MNLYVLVLLFVTLVWGTTFPVIQAGTAHLTGSEISALRFVVAGVCVLPCAWKASASAWRDGLLLGVVALVSYVTQAVGLEFIAANRSAFLTSLNVLMVPFLLIGWGVRLRLQVVAAALLACAGVGLMTWGGGANLLGDSLTLVCALAYAIYVILLSRCIQRHASRTLAATQIVVMACVGSMWMLASDTLRGTLPTLTARLLPAWPEWVYLGVVASAGMLFLQAVGQRHVAAERAAVIYALEPVFAALFTWLWLHEALGTRGLVGGALVVAAVILGEWRVRNKVPARA
ncbi:MAG: DMT family transporter [Gammaproteobacteria bacterium]